MPRSGSTTARWWVADAGSTNGIRVESRERRASAAAAPAAGAGAEPPIELADGRAHRAVGARRGPAERLPVGRAAAARRRPSRARDADRRRPRARRRRRSRRSLAARAGEPRFDDHRAAWRPASARSTLRADVAAVSRRPLAQPDAGRSTARHEGVSGHHLDIVDARRRRRATCVVHGDNGVVDRRRRATRRARASRWQAGETMVLGGALPTSRRCTLTLRARRTAMTRDGATMPQPDHAARARSRRGAAAPRRRAPARSRRSTRRAFRRIEAAVASSCGSQHAVNEDAHSALDGSGAPVRRRRRRRRRRDGAAGEPRSSSRTCTRRSTAQPRRRRRACARRCSTPTARSRGASRSVTDAPGRGDGRAVRAGRTRCASKWLIAWVGDCRVYRLAPARRRGARAADARRHLPPPGETPPPGGSPDDPARMVGNGAIAGANVALHELAPRRAAGAVQRRRAQARRRATTGAACCAQPLPLAQRCERLIALARAQRQRRRRDRAAAAARRLRRARGRAGSPPRPAAAHDGGASR